MENGENNEKKVDMLPSKDPNESREHNLPQQEALQEELYAEPQIVLEKQMEEGLQQHPNDSLEPVLPNVVGRVVLHTKEEPLQEIENRQPEVSTTKPKKPKNKWKITTIAVGVVLIFSFVIFGTALYSKDKTITNLQTKNDKLETKVDKLSAKVKTAEPWFEMTAEQQQEAEEQEAAKEAEEEAAAAAAKEEQEKVGYDTGITYDQLARTPDDYEGQKVKFTGKVIQVTDDTDEIDIRLAVDGDYDTVILCGYDPSIVSSRVLEDDEITIYGVSEGLYTYESTMGASITVPLVYIDKIDQ